MTKQYTITRQIVILAAFRLATFCPARQRYDKQGRKRERSPRENPPNGDSCFRMVTFRPATRKYATFHVLRFRLLFESVTVII